MKKKPIYKIIDEQGRLAVPQELRKKAGIEMGDIVHLNLFNGSILIKKLEIEESKEQDQEMLEQLIISAMKELQTESMIRISKQFIKLVEGKDE